MTVKNQISLLLCVLILMVPSARPQTPAKTPWALYTVKGESFTIALPAVPALETTKETRTPPQKDRKRSIIKCSIGVFVYTIQLVENTKPRLTLETFIQERTTANPTEKLTFERNLTLDGVAGKAFLYPDGKGIVQFFATDNRLYEIRAYGGAVSDPRIATFFHYLSLKKQEGTIELSESVQGGSFDSTMGKIVSGKEVDVKARLLTKPEPTYSPKAKSEQITGIVVLKCVFASDGTVTNIRVIQGLPYGLTEKAIEAARKIKFVPAMKYGKPVSMWMQLEYTFNLY